MSDATMIPSIGGRLTEMLVGNEQTGTDLAGLAMIPLMTAGVAKLATSAAATAGQMVTDIASVGRDSLGTLTPNISIAQAPVIAQAQDQGFSRTRNG